MGMGLLQVSLDVIVLLQLEIDAAKCKAFQRKKLGAVQPENEWVLFYLSYSGKSVEGKANSGRNLNLDIFDFHSKTF